MEHFLLRRPPRPLMSMTLSLLNARTTTKFLTTGWTILRSDVCRGDGLMNLIGQVIDCITDYGRPMKPFFIAIQNFWAWADKLGRQILGQFRPNYQHPFWHSESIVHYSTIVSTGGPLLVRFFKTLKKQPCKQKTV